MAQQYSSNAAIEGIKADDDNVELRGYVDSVAGRQIVGQVNRLTVFKFVLNNGAGKRIQCVAWEDAVDMVSQIVEMDKVIKIEGGCAKAFKNPRYNAGNVPFELTIKRISIIAAIGTREVEPRPIVEIPVVPWDEIADREGETIAVVGYVKFNFRESRHMNNESSYGFGSITNGEVKLEIRMTSMSGLPNNIQKGTAVKVVGDVLYGNYLYLKVVSGDDVILTGEPPFDPEQMFNITQPPTKRRRVNE